MDERSLEERVGLVQVGHAAVHQDRDRPVFMEILQIIILKPEILTIPFNIGESGIVLFEGSLFHIQSACNNCENTTKKKQLNSYKKIFEPIL